MNITMSQLKRLIKEEVRNSRGTLAEASVPQLPKTFVDFRKKVAASLTKLGAPKGLTDEVKDVGNEGGEVANLLYVAWNNIEDSPDVDVSDTIYDLVLDVCDAYQNPMNYAPGEAKGHNVKKNALVLAKGVAKVFSQESTGTKPSDDRKLKEMASLVVDVLHECGACADIKWDGGNTVTYRIIQSDYLEAIESEALKAGFTSASDEDVQDIWSDPITGLTVVFGDGVATIH